MNPYSGATYSLGADLTQRADGTLGFGSLIGPDEIKWGAENIERELTDSEQAALKDPGPLVLVSEAVAQKVQLGERELARRKSRRKTTKASRRRNR